MDFIAQYDGHVFPCEVKAENNVKAKSLHTFITNEFPELLITNVAYVLERFLSNVAYVLESFSMFFAYVLEKSCIFAVKFIYDGTKCTKENY